MAISYEYFRTELICTVCVSQLAVRRSEQEEVKTVVHHATTLAVEGQRPPAEVRSSLLFGTLGSVLRTLRVDSRAQKHIFSAQDLAQVPDAPVTPPVASRITL